MYVCGGGGGLQLAGSVQSRVTTTTLGPPHGSDKGLAINDRGGGEVLL